MSEKLPLRDKINNIYHDRGSYSSTAQCYLTSTVFHLGNYEYCIHCGDRASPVQNGLSSLNRRTSFEHYDTTGYRCNCDEALDEIIEKMAYQRINYMLSKPLTSEPKEYGVKREHYLKIISSMNADRLPLWGEDSSNVKPIIVSPSVESYRKFYADNDLDLKMYLKDDYYSYLPVVQLVRCIEHKMKELQEEEKKKIQKQLQEVEELDLQITAKW